MDQPSYSFGVPPSGAVLLGLTPHQLAAMAAGLVVLLAGLLGGAGLTGAVMGLAGAGAASLYCWLPIRGRPLHQWAGPLARHSATALCGRRWAALFPVVRAGPEGTARKSERMTLPPEFGRVSWLEVSQGGQDVGVLVEARGGAQQLTVVLRAESQHRCVLLSTEDQNRLISAWGSVLAATAVEGSPVRRVGLVERARPVRERPPLPPASAAADGLADYLALLDAVTERSMAHEVYVSLHLSARRENDETSARLAVEQAGALSARLRQVGIRAQPMSLLELSGLVRSYSSLGVICGGPEGAGPAGRQVGWDHLEIDGWWHRAYAVMAWPRQPVGAGWLRPLLEASHPGSVRTLALHYQPVPAALALKRARGARMRVLLSAAQRSRLGLMGSHTEARAATDAEDREAELVAGFAEHRLGAVVLLSAPSHEALETAARSLANQAVAAQVDLRVLFGHQELGWAAAMPLGRLRLSGGA